jgi:methionyl-tRNA formyltransferase
MISIPKIVFMGSPDFASPALRALSESYPVVGVVTQPDRVAGRGRGLKPPPVKTLAGDLGIPVIQPERLHQPEAMERLRSWSPDVIVVAAFGQILKREVLDLPMYGCLNVHASLLPRWRGAAPINAAILHGDAETGITIMKMDEGLDTGPILIQRAVRMAKDETAGSLFVTLSQLGAKTLLETLPGYLSGEISPQPQPDTGATYASMLTKEDGALDFTQPAEQLARQVRAFNPWPGTYFAWQGKTLKVHRAIAVAGQGQEVQVGRRAVHQGQPAVGTADGLLVLEEVQPAGKKPMPGRAFLAGARDWLL